MNYRGYTIEPETDPWPLKYGLLYFIGSGEDKINFISTDEAKSFVDEKIMMDTPPWFVNTQGINPLSGMGYNITKFTWLSEAVPFAVRYNGELTTTFNCP